MVGKEYRCGERLAGMKRSTFISLVDVLAFISFVLLLSTGFLMRYVLPPGSGGVESFGGGRGAGLRPVALVWGLTRHEWGGLHFWFSVAFLLLIGVHLAIHWKWITVSFRGENSADTLLLAGLGIAALIAVVALAAAPLFSEVRRVPRSQILPSSPVTAPAESEPRGRGWEMGREWPLREAAEAPTHVE
jgi:hypothetical protein